MAQRKIITPLNPILRKKARPVASITPEIRQLVSDMIETMKESNGVGLAAPQVAQSLQLFVALLEHDPDVVIATKRAEKDPTVTIPEPAPGVGKTLVCLNPTLSNLSAEMVDGEEGCLSIPGYTGIVERHESITLTYTNLKKQRVTMQTRGWMARVIQHEYDHLRGVLFIDKAKSVTEIKDVEEGM